MKYCVGCGTKLDDDAVFCPECGARQLGMKDVSPVINQAQVKPQKKKGNGKGIALFIIILALIIAAIVYFKILPMINSRRSLDLTDYLLTPEFEGFDGEGTIKDGTLSFDYTALQKAVDEKRGKSAETDPVDVKNFTIYLSVDKNEELKNGDEITVSLDYDAGSIKNNYGLTFDLEGKEKTFTVANLEEYKKVDAFKGLSLNFTGISPYAKAELTGDVDLGYYDVEINNGLGDDSVKAGDTITVSFSENGENTLKQEGKVAKSDSVEVEVTDDMLSTYVTSLDDIQSDIMDELKASTDNIIESYKAMNNITADTTYVGSWFLTPRDGHWDDNRVPVLINIYSYPDTDYDGNTVTKYLAINCPAIYVEGSGTVSLISERKTSGEADSSTGSLSSKKKTSDEADKDSESETKQDNGNDSDNEQEQNQNQTFDRSEEGEYSDVERYDDEQDLYQNVVQRYLDNYNYEATDGLKSLGQ